MQRYRSINNCISAALVVVACTSTVQAQTSAGKTASATSTPARNAAVADSLREIAKLKEEDVFYAQRLLQFRALYLKGSSWASMGDRCDPGTLRVFPRDTSGVQQDSLNRLVMRMEQTVLGRGSGRSVDTPEGRALLRVIVGWEAGIDRPNWDTDDKAPHRAIAAGLTGEYPDPRGSGCLAGVVNDTVTVVAPAFTDMIFPQSPKVRIKAYLGREGLQHARNEFAAVHMAPTDTAQLSYLYIAPFVMWQNWAVVVVTRPLEARGVEVGRTNNGGAAYLMRKVGTEWRLLSILRTWGS